MQHLNRPINNTGDSEIDKPVKIMLADDDLDDQQTFAAAIEEAHIKADITIVENGQEVIDKLKDPSDPNPDIIFLDVNMPIKDGKETLEEIKSDETLKNIPTVMLSTSDHPKDVEETFEQGANLYIKKPSSFRGLIMLIKKVFKLHWAKTLLNPIRKSFLVTEQSVSKEE